MQQPLVDFFYAHLSCCLCVNFLCPQFHVDAVCMMKRERSMPHLDWFCLYRSVGTALYQIYQTDSLYIESFSEQWLWYAFELQGVTFEIGHSVFLMLILNSYSVLSWLFDLCECKINPGRAKVTGTHIHHWHSI